MKNLDLGLAVSATNGTTMTLTNPGTGVAIKLDQFEGPAGFIVHGTDSEQYRKAQRGRQRRGLDSYRRTKDATLTPEQGDAEDLILYAACVSGWVNFCYDDETVFTPELLKRFLDEQRWALEQVKEYIEKRANFLTA